MKLNKSVRIFADKHLENIGSTFRSLYQGDFLTDCILICKDGSIKAHKLVLSLSSTYFRRIFSEHSNDKAIFIMYGIKFSQLRDLIELIYKGFIDISSDQLDSVYDLVKEFQIDGILVDGTDKEFTPRPARETRDTRFKGNKRVAVDFEEQILIPSPKHVADSTNTENNTVAEQTQQISLPQAREEEVVNGVENQIKLPDYSTLNENTINATSLSTNPIHEDELMGHPVDEETKLSAWARKERKFKCDLCPSSFKRASHLSRHQLVHTGERPYACSQCDKAFSRHDKLKHHVQRAHELDILNDQLPPDSLYTIGHVQILTPEQTMIEMAEPIDTSEENKPYTSPINSMNSLNDDDAPKPKKGRGRPRKYPITFNPIPTVKRPRGRPRTRPTDIPKIKRPRGRPRIRPIGSLPGDMKDDSSKYDDDMEASYEVDDDLSPQPENCPDIMEPLVEIKMEPQETPERPIETADNPSASFFQNIGLFENNAAAIGKIGECTISVASSSNTNINRNPEIYLE